MSYIPIATRRDFLAGGLGVVGISSVLPEFLIRTAAAGPAAEVGQRVLVVIQLGGGHDAMSALVPYGHEEYAKARNVTRIKDEEVIKLNAELGLHPNLAGLKQLYDEGAMAVLPGVGYPDPNLSHFHSTDIWHTADMRGRLCEFGKGPYGWVGKTCDAAFPGNLDPKLAIAVGTGSTPIAIQGKDHPGLAFDTPDSFGYRGDRGDATRRETYRALNEAAREKPETLTELHFVTKVAIAANGPSQPLEVRSKGQIHPLVLTEPSHKALAEEIAKL